jgi:sodium-dependent phosphate cotransporter
VLFVVGLLFLFLVGVKSLESGIKSFGADAAETLFASVDHPLAALFAGVLATVLVQSSSVTTATIVGLVGAGVLPLDSAVPMVMGANIGTTVTNTLVSIGHIRRGEEFRRAFAGATVHDFFNLLAVAVALPLELLTGFLSRSAEWLSELLRGQTELSSVAPGSSPIKQAVGYPVDLLHELLDATGAGPVLIGTILIAVGLAAIFGALTFITKNMRIVMAGRIQASFNALLDRGAGLGAIALGLVITVLVQSSSITTSILIPMVGAGVLSLKNAFPVTLGANVGTTITALLASLAAERPEGLTIALVHVLFNVFGILLFYPVPALRMIPLRLATGLADLAQRRKRWVLVYVMTAFVIVPLAGIVVLR